MTTEQTKQIEQTELTEPPAKHPGGRPPIEFDMKIVEVMGRFRATYETMAEYFGCTKRTIENYMTDEESEFFRQYKKGKAEISMKLSEAQMKTAIEDRNPTMLIWLGKQYLGQTDKQDITQRSTNENKITVEIIPGVLEEPNPVISIEADTDEAIETE